MFFAISLVMSMRLREENTSVIPQKMLNGPILVEKLGEAQGKILLHIVPENQI